MKKLIYVIGLSVIIAFPVLAYDYYIDPHEIDAITVEEDNPWDVWDVNQDEWQRYQDLMQGEAGLWYRDLDPIEVLGIYAETDSEREHYAIEVMKRKEIREGREWAFSNAIDKEAQRRYQGLPLVRPFDVSPFRRKPTP